MFTMMSLGNWSLSEFKAIDTLDDLLWWHNKIVEDHNKRVRSGNY